MILSVKMRFKNRKFGAFKKTMKNILDYDPKTHIIIKGAHLHNLKYVDIAIPRNKLTVITGLSGSGKSSLAFDTLYAEGQRRYVESLSSYARQFMGRLNKPKVDFIKGLSPAIAVEQKVNTSNPRSTVGTKTDLCLRRPNRDITRFNKDMNNKKMMNLMITIFLFFVSS